MDVIPTWRSPHYFLHFQEGQPPVFAFTYGLLVGELVRIPEHGVDQRAADRIGWQALAKLVDDWSAKESSDEDIPLLAAVRKETLPKVELETFRQNEVPGIATWVEYNVAPAFADIARAAKRGERPSPERLPLVEDLMATHRPALDLVRMRNLAGKESWGLGFRTLGERIATELFDLLTLRPRLRVCRFCGAVFVPTATEANCRFNLWKATTCETIQRCSPEEAFDAYAQGEHVRTRKRLSARMRRAAEGPGENSGAFKKAKRELGEYMAIHGRRPGPKPTPEPDFVRS